MLISQLIIIDLIQKLYFIIKNVQNVSISEKISELEENLAPPTRPRYQGPLQNLPMRIKSVTAQAYLNQLKDKNITPSNVGKIFYGKEKQNIT